MDASFGLWMPVSPIKPPPLPSESCKLPLLYSPLFYYSTNFFSKFLQASF
jgi:hypothetical protein